MRKYLVGVFAMALVGSFAFAGTLVVPQFFDQTAADGGSEDGSFPPSSGSAAFIGIANTTNSAILLTLTYTRANGDDRTPVANTYLLGANQTVGFRPRATDGSEGVGQAVPNMVIQAGDSPAGVATITYAGAGDQLAGRYIQIDSAGNVSAYALIPKD